MENISAFVDAVIKAKPAGRQGHVRQEGFDQVDDGASVKIDQATFWADSPS